MDYTYTLEKDRKTGYVRIHFAESDRWSEEKSPFHGAEILLGHTFPCYAMVHYLAGAESFLEHRCALNEDDPTITMGQYCDNIGFCTGHWQDRIHAEIPDALMLPEDAVFVESQFTISFFPRKVLLEILRDYLRACVECSQAHLRWLKHRKYPYTVRFDHEWNHAGLKPRNKNDSALGQLTSLRECFERVPMEYPSRSFCDRYFAYLFRKDWVVFGIMDEGECHVFRCLPLHIFQKIAREFHQIEADRLSDFFIKRQKREWRKVQLSGKMWPMP